MLSALAHRIRLRNLLSRSLLYVLSSCLLAPFICHLVKVIGFDGGSATLVVPLTVIYHHFETQWTSVRFSPIFPPLRLNCEYFSLCLGQLTFFSMVICFEPSVVDYIPWHSLCVAAFFGISYYDCSTFSDCVCSLAALGRSSHPHLFISFGNDGLSCVSFHPNSI